MFLRPRSRVQLKGCFQDLVQAIKLIPSTPKLHHVELDAMLFW